MEVNVAIDTRIWAVLLMATSACSGGGGGPVQQGSSGLDKTGLEGTMRRGPIQPVCQVGEPCDGPLEAGFTLRQGGQVAARFRSDSDGHFRVFVAPGSYAVVPDEDAPLLQPGQQAQEVSVGVDRLTQVDLTFDTGIR